MNGIGITKIETNPVTDKLRSGQPTVGAWLSLCSRHATYLFFFTETSSRGVGSFSLVR